MKPYQALLQGVSRYSTAVQPSRIVFSGIQPTGTPHIGNYVGAIKQWVKYQEDDGCQNIFSVVDLHAITMPQNSDILRQNRRETFAALLAAGLDTDRSTVFYQSAVPAHGELMWILSCRASMGYLSRMTQWKTKLSLSNDTEALDDASKAILKLGLFSYPVLQAADILLYRATEVPVGDDQKQHIEFARECVTNFNSTYHTNILVPPKTVTSNIHRIKSLQNPTVKMSKSDTDPKSRILITDTPDEIHKKIKVAVTDPENRVSYDPINRPGVANLLDLLSAFDSSKRSADQLADSTPLKGASLRTLKNEVTDAITKELSGVRERYYQILQEDDGRYVDFVAEKGNMKAREIAEDTMQLVRKAVGFN